MQRRITLKGLLQRVERQQEGGAGGLRNEGVGVNSVAQCGGQFMKFAGTGGAEVDAHFHAFGTAQELAGNNQEESLAGS